MKNGLKLFWIIAIVAVIGLSMAACGGDGDGGGGGYYGGDWGGGGSTPTSPSAPSGVRAILSSSGDKVTITWNSVYNADHYYIYSSASSSLAGSSYSAAKYESNSYGTSATFEWTWSTETRYFYVTSANAAGESNLSFPSSGVSANTGGGSGGGGGGGSGSGGGSGTGTVILKNESPYNGDNVYAEITRTSNDALVAIANVNKGSTKTWSDIPTGVSLRLSVVDPSYDVYQSSSFTLSSGQTKTFTYDGFSVR